MILCPPEDLFKSVKLETVAAGKEVGEGFSVILLKIMAVFVFIFWCFVVFLRYGDTFEYIDGAMNTFYGFF